MAGRQAWRALRRLTNVSSSALVDEKGLAEETEEAAVLRGWHHPGQTQISRPEKEQKAQGITCRARHDGVPGWSAGSGPPALLCVADDRKKIDTMSRRRRMRPLA